MNKRRPFLAITTLCIGILAFILTFGLAATGAIDQFAYQVRYFSKTGSNLFEIAITILTSLVLITVPAVGAWIAISGLRKIKSDPAAYSGKAILITSVIVNLLAAALYLVFAGIAYGAGPRVV